jgi:anti-anti-sigma regulatory factor
VAATLTGQLTFGQEDLDIRTELNRFIAAGKTRVVFNLNHLARLDHAGLGTLLYAHDALGRLVAPWQLSTYTDPISNSWKQNWEPY